ncbi:hypothetical protein O6H91_06G077200 [Diphasiastrum complanatum]|nr:hypothetical protein O6H91_06G077200 [Diphasiastrum complanatum]
MLPPRNRDLFPELASDHLIIVLYVHNRPNYLRVVVNGLSKVEGISETLLIVSHDGFYEEMNAIIEKIRFCQVKEIFAPFSPHLFPESFPGVSDGDCQDKDDPATKKCNGVADQYGNHRSPRIVSLKHHWWWMMNTLWDGLVETRNYDRHMVFIEEDHYLFPNAYRNIQTLCRIKSKKCTDCWTANLAPYDVNAKGERTQNLIQEKMGNIGYAVNRTVWRKIHGSAKEFCSFDDYNWDITMWASVYPSWNSLPFSLRGPRRSAVHFGKCGLHQGNKKGKPACLDPDTEAPPMDPEDSIPNINEEWKVVKFGIKGYTKGFNGWGGWGDSRDHRLCLDFAAMYWKT